MFDLFYAISSIDKNTSEKVKKIRDELGLMRFRPRMQSNNNQWIWPTKSKTITSGYGWRIHPIFKTKIFHYGIDIGEENNKPVWAVADGKVVMAQWYGGYGKYVEIDHGNGIHSFYGHLNSYDVKVGDYVTQGQEIGKVGNTGQSTGNHLHFGVKKGDTSINPFIYLPK